MSILVIGHRGMGPTSTLPELPPDALPENSLAAISHAIDIGGDGVEFDVLLTADNNLVVLHDPELNKKIDGADRSGHDLGLVSDYTLEQLQAMSIGNGHRIPSVNAVLDLIVGKNDGHRKKTGKDLLINIELKGHDTANQLYLCIAEYINSGKLKLENFIFNSFKWDTLREIKALDSRFKVMPAIRTSDLFGKENVTMPGFRVDPRTPYSSSGLEKLERFHAEVDCYAFDCIVFDLRPEFVDFCEDHGIGLFTSTSREIVEAEKVRGPLTLMLDAGQRLPIACFRADNVTDTRRVVASLTSMPKLNLHFSEVAPDAEFLRSESELPYSNFQIV